MDEIRATLQLDLQSGHSLDAIVAGNALITWASALREASLAIDPTSPMLVELVGTEVACLRLHAILRFLESKLDKADDALAPYPKLRAALALNVFNLPGMFVAGALGAGAVEIAKHYAADAPPQVQRAAQDATNRLEASPSARGQVERFYQTVDAGNTVQAVRIYEADPNKPIVSVPRDQFTVRGGLWVMQDADPVRRPQGAVWDVIVTHPAAISKPRVWGFKRDGLPFRAKLADPLFLAAIGDRTLPLAVHEGTLMRVRVQWMEELTGDEWVANNKTYVITRVLWPTPLTTPAPLPLLTQPD